MAHFKKGSFFESIIVSYFLSSQINMYFFFFYLLSINLCLPPPQMQAPEGQRFGYIRFLIISLVLCHSAGSSADSEFMFLRPWYHPIDPMDTALHPHVSYQFAVSQLQIYWRGPLLGSVKLVFFSCSYSTVASGTRGGDTVGIPSIKCQWHPCW